MLTRGRSVFTPVFSVPLGARPFPVCRFETGSGPALRHARPHPSIAGPIPEGATVHNIRTWMRPRLRHGAIPTNTFPLACGDSACWRLRLLSISPTDRTAVLRSGPQFVPDISSTDQTLHFLRGRSEQTSPCRFRLTAHVPHRLCARR